MEITVSVGDGTLSLKSTRFVDSEEAFEGPSLKFHGSLYGINDALAGMTYLVSFFRTLTALKPSVQLHKIYSSSPRRVSI